MMKKLCLIVFLMFVVSGCETMEGLGKDIQKLGAGIEKNAKEKTE